MTLQGRKLQVHRFAHLFAIFNPSKVASNHNFLHLLNATETDFFQLLLTYHNIIKTASSNKERKCTIRVSLIKKLFMKS